MTQSFRIQRDITALAFIACSAPAALSGQTSPEPTLDYGEHGVGFTVIEALDSTRAFRPLRDFRGATAAETARPVQVSLWYPADVSAEAPRMRAGEFRLLMENEIDFDPARASLDAAQIRSRFIDQVVGFGQDPAIAARLWDAATPAVRDAAPVPGRHPTLIYMTSAGVSDPLLPAYLASHGFVVASFPAHGRMTKGTLEFTPNALTLDTDIDDAGFVYALLRRLPYSDTRRLAVASFSAGSLAALLWTMRDMQVGAIVALEGWERYRRGADIISTSVHFEPYRVRVPFLMIERAADETSPQYAKVPDVVAALPYADITRVAFRDASHGDFLSHAAFGHTPHHREIYETSAAMIRRFLQSSIGDDVASRDFTLDDDNPIFTVERQLPVGPVPTEEEMYRLAETDATAAEAAYRDAVRIVPGATLFRRHVMIRAARFAATAEDSATIMRIVDDAYPVNAQDLWGGMEPGPFAVGFSVIEARDSARSLANGNRRPLQISYWYPAEGTSAPSSAARVHMRDYFVLTATELTLEPLNPGDAEATVEGFKRFMASNDISGAAVDAWLSLRGRSVRDARPLSDNRFPLVVIAPGNFHAAYHHAALAEYLASHGYIVAAAPSQSRIGGPPAEGQSPGIGAEEQASDLRFVVSTLGRVATADTNAVGIVAHSFGARSAFLVLIDDDPHVKALVSLDGGIANQAGKDWLTGVHWDPSAIHTPILHFYQEVDETVVPDFELISSLAESDRLLVRVDSLYHPHFTGLGTASGIVNGFRVGPDSPDVLAKLAAINSYTRRFLDTHVRGRPDSLTTADVVESNALKIRHIPALR